MTSLRLLLLRHRAFAAWLVAAALLMKVLVPAGFMPVVSAGSITIELCSGYGPQKLTVAMPGMHHQQHKPDHQGKEMPCGFSGLSAPSLAATDPLLLGVAIAFIIATIFLIATPNAVRTPAFLRPPLRGPPTRA